MDELMKASNLDFSNIAVPTLLDFVLGYIVAMVCSIIIAYCYRQTHSGYSFSSSFMVSLILVSVIISLIMIIIGSNIARAFALVGAMSIVRFRNPVKETRDLVFIFAAIAVGMAAGTGFYMPAILFSVLFVLTTMILDRSSICDANSFVHIVAIKGEDKDRIAFEERVKNDVKQFTLLSMSSATEGSEKGEFVYELELDKPGKFEALKNSLVNDPEMPSMRLIFGNSTVST